MFDRYQEILNVGLFTYFLQQMRMKLQERDQHWVGNIAEITTLQQRLCTLQLEKGITLANCFVDEYLSGEKDYIQHMVALPKALEQFSDVEIKKLIDKFRKKNVEDLHVQGFCDAN